MIHYRPVPTLIGRCIVNPGDKVYLVADTKKGEATFLGISIRNEHILWVRFQGKTDCLNEVFVTV